MHLYVGRPPPVYELLLEAAEVGFGVVEATGTTNLPVGSKVTIAAYRLHRLCSERATRSGTLGAPRASVKVKERGRFAVRLELAENDDETRDTWAASGECFVPFDRVAVAALFDPEAQDAQVAALVGGPTGDATSLRRSRQASVFGSATDNPVVRLEAETRIAAQYTSQ